MYDNIESQITVEALNMFKQYRAEATAVAADDYELQYSGKVNDIIPVWKYRSRKTGLRIVVAEVQGPLVNGYLCLGMFRDWMCSK